MSDMDETLRDFIDRRLRELDRRRGGRGRRSLRAAYMELADDNREVTYEVMRRAANGHTALGLPAQRTLAALLEVESEVIADLVGQRPELGPFELPERANKLDQHERDVILGVVDAILAAAERPDVTRPVEPTPLSPVDGAAVPEDLDLAARRPGQESAGKAARRAQDEAGEESQEP